MAGYCSLVGVVACDWFGILVIARVKGYASVGMVRSGRVVWQEERHSGRTSLRRRKQVGCCAARLVQLLTYIIMLVILICALPVSCLWCYIRSTVESAMRLRRPCTHAAFGMVLPGMMLPLLALVLSVAGPQCSRALLPCQPGSSMANDGGLQIEVVYLLWLPQQQCSAGTTAMASAG